MILIPGQLVALATFPGVIVHEVAHMWFCKLRGLAVLDVCFFRFGNPAGYVVHEETENFNTAFLVSMGPFIVNSLLCIFICLPAFLPMRVFGVESPLSYFLLWLGISIGMHAFPSTGDAHNLYHHARKAASSGNILATLTLPLVALIYLANIGRVFWLDYIYGAAIGLGLPSLLL
ncbi:MAG: DUF3267 domain-containing protein [Planctomycetota bacterium]|jgi:hypothetical protein